MRNAPIASLRLVVTDKAPGEANSARPDQPPPADRKAAPPGKPAAPPQKLVVPAAKAAEEGPRRFSFPIALALIIVATIILGWNVRSQEWYTPAKGLGYALGLVGGTTMLLLLLYPARKRIPILQGLGPLKYWFRLHMAGGIAGPLLVLFHSTFHVGSLNAAVALTCMLIVVASGLVGRFLYRKIHHGLYGSHATFAELQQSVREQLATLGPLLRLMPGVDDEVARFAQLVDTKPAGLAQRMAHFLSLGWKRLQARRRIRRAIADFVHSEEGASIIPHADLHALTSAIDAALGASQRAAQLSTYERLFSLWHVMHIPFLCLLVATAIVHVVAVHAY